MKKLSKILSVVLIMAMLITAVPLYSAAAENYLWPVPKGNNNYIYLESLPGINIKGGDKVFATKSGTVVYSYYGCGNNSALTTGVPCSSATCNPSASFYTNKDYNIRLCNWGYGNGFVLKHSDGSGYSFYGHMGVNYVRTGDKVYRGQHVGMMGGSGLSFVENLYFATGSDYKKSGTYYYAGSTYANGRNDIDYDYYPGASPVTIHSQGAKDITHNSITFYIDITVDTDYVRQLQLDVGNSYYDLEKYSSAGTVRKTYTYTVNNLSPSTDYSYRFLATILQNWGTSYVDTERFTVTTRATPPSSVSLNKTSAKMFIGNTTQLSAKISPADAQKGITWTSSDSSVATVSGGLVTAKKAGTATITATTVNGKTATCKITVKKKTVPATAVTLDKTSLKLYTGDKSTLRAKVTPSNTTDNLKWTSSNTKVATVENGVITAKSAGTAKITVKTDSGKTATCKVTVTKKVIPATAVKLDKTSVTLEKGDVSKLTAKVTPSNTTDKLTWKSSDTKVATVKDGVITAKAAGTAKITVKTSSGKTATCKVTVKKAQKKWTAANQYSFGNSYSEFITGRYTMSDADFERLSTYVRKQYSEETAKYYIDRLTASRENDRWGGSCYGMSVTALLDFDDRISMMENFDPDAASISAVDSPKHNAAVQSAINYYQLSQQIGFIGNNDGAFYRNGNANWREGLISLVEAAKKNEPVLFCYWFSAGGHAIVIKSCKGTDSDGNYVLVAYDNRYPEKDITVLVDSAYSSLTVDGKKEVAYAFQFLTDFSVFDAIDIDGPNDDMVISSKKPGNINSAKPGTEVSVLVTSDDITIWDDNDKYISIKNGVIKSTMDIASTRLIVHSAKDGKAAPAELIFSINDSDSFTFKAEDKQISASVLSSDSFASVEANGADAATISETDGVSVSGNKAEYTVHKSVDESDFEMFCFSGVSAGVSSVNYSGGAVYVSGNNPGSINVGKFGGGDYEELSFNTTKENVEIKISDSPARKKGDVDGDGAISAGDARLALRRSVGLESYTESSSEFKSADVDGNGQVLADDARRILRVSVGLEKF